MASGPKYHTTSIIQNKYDTIRSILIINYCYKIMSLHFSPSGRMLLVTSADKTASIWNVPSGTTWSTTPHVTLKGHASVVSGGAFLGDESHVITGSCDSYLRIWRTSDGVQTANYQCGGPVCHILSIYITHPFCYIGVFIVVSCCVWQHYCWSS